MTKATATASTVSKLLGLVGIAAFSTLAVTMVERSTRDQIAANQTAYELQSVAAVLPIDSYNNQPQQTVRVITDAMTNETLKAYIAYQDSVAVAVALEVVAQEGYVGPIRILVGLNRQGELIAIRTIEHRETPGLGDRIEHNKSPWAEQFANSTANEKEIRLRRDGGDIDHLSGATITSRAVTNSIRQALLLAERHHDELFAARMKSDQPTR